MGESALNDWGNSVQILIYSDKQVRGSRPSSASKNIVGYKVKVSDEKLSKDFGT